MELILKILYLYESQEPPNFVVMENSFKRFSDKMKMLKFSLSMLNKLYFGEFNFVDGILFLEF